MPSPTSAADEEGSGGGGSGVSAVWEFVDEQLEGQFDAGDMVDVEWLDQRLQLVAGAPSGTFYSRIFDAGAVGQWSTLAWTPYAPYGRRLPNDGGDETEYVAGGADMANNALMLHADDLQRGETLDGSGNDNHGEVQVVGGYALELINNGVFGSALHNPTDAALLDVAGSYLEVANGAALGAGAEDMTWSVWFRSESCPGSNGKQILTYDQPDVLDGTGAVWLACGCAAGPGLAFGFRVGGVGPSDCVDEVTVPDGRWHHIAMTKSQEYRLYFDGEPVFSQSEDVPAAMPLDTNMEFTVIGTADPTFPGHGDVDEVAVWRRALSDMEVHDLFLRGALDLKIRVRACMDPECRDADFVGPGGMRGVSFQDRGGILPWDPRPLPEDLIGRYVQYEVTMGGPPEGLSPGLLSVAILGGPA